MFHYGSIGNELDSNANQDLVRQLDSLNGGDISPEEKDEVVILNPPDSAQEKVNSESLITDLKSGWLGSEVESNNPQQNSSFLRCQCALCHGAIPRQSEGFDASTDTTSTGGVGIIPETPNLLSQDIIDRLVWGNRWGRGTSDTPLTVTYSFYEDDVFDGRYYGSETGVREVSDGIKSSVREILEIFETFVNIDFQEVTESSTGSGDNTIDTYGQIRYMLSDFSGYAYAYSPIEHPDATVVPRAGDVHLNYTYDNASSTNGFQSAPGRHGYMTLIHETLHALGLTHPRNYGVVGNPNSPDGEGIDLTLDNTSNTSLSYDFRGSTSATAMPFDIATLQYIYGAAENNTGDTTYVFGSTTDVFTVDGSFQVFSPNRIRQTIWDSDGIDTLDFSQLGFTANGYFFDLNQGGWLVGNSQISTDGGTGERSYSYGTSLSYGMTIENIIGSTSNDTVLANSAANVFSGYSQGGMFGDDTFFATNQLDTLDLSDYLLEDVAQSQSGNNLVIDLGSGGSITIDSYYDVPESERIQIEFAPAPFTPPPVNPKVAIAEIGQVTNANHNQQTIQLQNDYVNPVVFAQPLSRNGADPAIIRITDIDADNDTFSFYLQEAEYRDGWHLEESFSYIVVEAGTWQLDDGTFLEVGTVETDKIAKWSSSAWEDVSFNHDFASTPTVLSQVQTNNDTEFVRARQRNADANGFLLSLEEEEALRRSGHGSETVGWLAIESGSGAWDDLAYRAGNTGNVVDHNWHELDFSDFSSTPNLLGSIATYNGGDSSGLRYQEISGVDGSTIEIKLEEDQSLDSETSHTQEDINFLAIAGSGILTAEAYIPDSDPLLGDNSFVVEEVDFV